MVCAALLQMAWGRGKRGLALTFGLLWFAAAQSPNTGIVVPVDGIVSEHWMYMPTMGLFLGIAESFSGILRERRKAGVLLVAAMTSALCVATFRQNMVWRNIDTLYKNTRAHGGRARLMSCDEGLYLLKRGSFGRARQTLQYCLNNLPQTDAYDRSRLHAELAMTWLHAAAGQGEMTAADLRRARPADIEAAKKELQAAVREAPRYDWARNALAVIDTGQRRAHETAPRAQKEKALRDMKGAVQQGKGVP